MIRSKLVLVLTATILLVAGWLVARTTYAAGTTVTVTSTTDASDRNIGDGVCDFSVNPGDQCTLRAAIEELNALGPDTTPHHIEFNIGGVGPFTIAPGSALPAISVPVVIDGATQSGASCPTATTAATLLIVLDGSNAGTGVDGLTLSTGSDGSTVRGLVIGNFDDDGLVITSDDNVVRCNHIGIGADGVSDIGNDDGVIISGDNNTIGGQSADARRNVVSGNTGSGIYISSGDDNTVANNFIGTTADGTAAQHNGSGVYVLGDGNTVGGTAARARNVISGNSGFGIRINTGTNTTVYGNLIGVARDGSTALPNTGNGIEIMGDATDNVVGGIAPGQANLIANNSARGVSVTTNVAGVPIRNQIRGNAIFANGNIGIDLAADGVDVNDAGDVDGGENEHQNYPVLTTTPGSLTVDGTLDSHANLQYTIDLYRSPTCDSSGNGEGQIYVTSLSVTTNGSGHADFSVLISGAAAGDHVTATATDPSGNTSEFSACAILTQVATATPTNTPTNTPTKTPTATTTATTDPSATATTTATTDPSATATTDPSATATTDPSATATTPAGTPTATLPPGVTPTLPTQPSDYTIALPLVVR